MCTLTVVPTGSGYRVAFNRDERPDRRPAFPPTVFGRAVFPIDPESQGTWLAVTDSGLTLALLNGNPTRPNGNSTRPTSAGRASRGTIVPAIATSADPADALVRAAALPLADFAPFRLVAVGVGAVADLRWDGFDAHRSTRPLADEPVLFTSSGLGDALVTPPRTALFTEMFGAGAWLVAQDAFHAHRWSGQEHLSVNMLRPSASTVSFAIVEVGAHRATFRYHPAAPHEPGADTVLELPLAAGVSA